MQRLNIIKYLSLQSGFINKPQQEKTQLLTNYKFCMSTFICEKC